jgi:hypothetical protein
VNACSAVKGYEPFFLGPSDAYQSIRLRQKPLNAASFLIGPSSAIGKVEPEIPQGIPDSQIIGAAGLQLNSLA